VIGRDYCQSENLGLSRYLDADDWKFIEEWVREEWCRVLRNCCVDLRDDLLAISPFLGPAQCGAVSPKKRSNGLSTQYLIDNEMKGGYLFD
jgi:hypothetical protein